MNQIVEGTTKAEIPSRRVVLHRALAVGCGLLVPAALFGCGKKEADSAGAAPESASPVTAKVSQASVHYQAQPKGDQQCSKCVHFIAELNACKLVEGQISPTGWCTLWTKKA